MINCNSRNTIWIVDPFTQVKSAEYIAKFNIKLISNLGSFYSFSCTQMSKVQNVYETLINTKIPFSKLS